jgi:multicomponent Na+:H+ antiporter subunit E
VLLANTLNLLPGTVALDIEGKTLRVHVLDSRLPIAEEVAAVEIHIARMFGIAP